MTARPPLASDDESGDNYGEPQSSAASFEGFYRTHAAWAARLAYLLVGETTAAEDIVQDGFAALNQRWQQVDHPAAYLRTTIVHAATRHRRRERTRAALQPMLWVDALANDAPRELFDVVGRLPARQRAVIVMRYFEDLSEAEIAEALGCRPGTVKSLAARALQTLRTELRA
ncbi:MAG TPA: SigE family RNA polymerase sigma factor [Acidimicrobiia bacterium]